MSFGARVLWTLLVAVLIVGLILGLGWLATHAAAFLLFALAGAVILFVAWIIVDVFYW